MTRIHRIFLIGVILLLGAAAALAGETPGRHWVQFTDRGVWETMTPDQIDRAAIEHGLTREALDRRRLEGFNDEELITIRDLPPDPAYLGALEDLGAQVHVTSRWFNLASVRADAGVLAAIEELPFVDKVWPVNAMKTAGIWYEVVETFDGNPPPGPGISAPGTYGPSYHQALQVNAVEAHRRGITGKGVRLCVIDGGFELSHEAFAQIDVLAEWDVTENDDYTGQEEEDVRGQAAHGTGCLSEIGGYAPGNLIGIAYEATFLLAKTEYIPTETVQEEDDWAAAIEWAERLGAQVTSSSLGYTDWLTYGMLDGATSITAKASNRAFELGVVPVTSASNSGPQPMTLGTPADAWGALTVGAADSLGRIGRFSSRGPTADGRTKPDIVARGVQTLLVSPYSEHRYSYWNGTSMSCPIGAGVAALVRQAKPDWSADKVVRALKTTADRADRPDNTYGWGFPDVMAALRYPEIAVTVKTEGDAPMEGVLVTLLTGEGVWHEAVTDAGGTAHFANLEPGDYTYEVELPDGFTVVRGELKRDVQVADGVAGYVALAREDRRE